MRETDTTPTITPLAWDTDFFGFQIGRLELKNYCEPLIEAGISKARSDGYRLIFLSIDAGPLQTEIPRYPSIGDPIDTKTTFFQDLTEFVELPVSSRNETSDSGFFLKEKPKGPAGHDLEQLAILSGIESRFFKDTRFSRDKVVQMYQIWINKCSIGELADCVIEAYSLGQELVGFITAKHTADSSTIGLFAVDTRWQGRGIGSALMAEVSRLAIQQSVRRISVVTQGANLTACRTYLRNGYSVLSRYHVFHVWL